MTKKLKNQDEKEIGEPQKKGFMHKRRNLLGNSRGVTLIQVILVIIVILVLLVTINPIGMFQKATRGSATTGWTTDLVNLSNNIVTDKEKYRLMYTTRISNPTTPYDLTVSAPPVSAYDAVSKFIVEKPLVGSGERIITYDKNATIKYSELAGVTTIMPGYRLRDFRNETIKETGTGATMLEGITYAGSDGIAPFINKAIPKVEEHLFYGLMGAQDLTLGKEYKKDRKFAGLGTVATLPELLKKVFGSGTVKTLEETAPLQWVTLNIMDSVAMAERLTDKTKFSNQEKYRLYYVTNIVTFPEALTIIKPGLTEASVVAGDAKMVEELRELYEALTANLFQDSLVVMPNDKRDVVYTEGSGYKLYKFTTAD